MRARFRPSPIPAPARTARHLALRVERELQLHERPALGDAHDVAARHPVRLAAPHAALDDDARRRNASSPRPATRGSGSSMATTARFRPAATMASAHGGVCAVMRARLERHVDRRAARLRPPRPWLRLGVRPAAPRRSRARSLPRSPHPRSRRRRTGWAPSRRARARRCASAIAIMSAIECSCSEELGHALTSASSGSPPRTSCGAEAIVDVQLLARIGIAHLAQHLLKIRGLPEVAIDRSEAHVGDGIEPAQRLHDEFADCRRT